MPGDVRVGAYIHSTQVECSGCATTGELASVWINGLGYYSFWTCRSCEDAVRVMVAFKREAELRAG